MAADETSKAAGHPIARVLPLLSPAHLDRDFDYLVPAGLDEIARPGVRVRVRFAGRLVDGYLLERLPRSDHNGKMMPLERVVSPERVLAPEILRLATAVATRYAGTRADVLRLAIPPRHARTETGGTKKAGTAAKAAPVTEFVDNEENSPSDVVAEAGGNGSGESAGGATSDQPDATTAEVRPESSPEVSVAQSRVEVDASAWGRYVHGLAFVDALAHGKGARAAWQALPGENWAARLAELAATVVASGRSAVLMVPDQRDLDRLLAECVALVGDSAVGLSAGLGPAARYRRWLAVLRGQARIVVGTRAAVFAPAQDLGLIAIWDDGDDTYAEPRSPYPHAREVAMLRAHETGAAFVAAGFARTAEIQAVVESGWARDLLAERQVLREVTPRISAPGDSDFALERDALARSVRMPGVAFAAARSAIKENVAVLVQVPRRGYVPSLACAKCRTPARCRHCNGPLALPQSANGEAASPNCKWCGITEAAFRCQACGARALRATVIGAARTAEELGRAFAGVPIRTSGGGEVLDTVEPGAQVVVATVGAEPLVQGGYGVALLLDGWALLGRADLRASEDTLRRWMGAAALVRPRGQVIVMAEPSLPTVQALVRWDPVNHAAAELEARAEVGFPPAVRLAAVDGTTASIAELLDATTLPDGTEVLGPVPLPPTARKPFSGADSPAEVERMLLRVPRSGGAPLARALTAAQAVRSSHRSDAPLRVQIDPVDIG
ncbi:primosomal protein N' [Nocardia salmonicida]|uniref:primosomal protein N' n=1 Tax=Nocardia salmonicida TaxID=53431 RepID=UPI000AE1F48A|nr:primosomal protein N' [Nocardia salmonicida]